jgi:trehalose/maltose hydrolase-like predicted phosphorylase
MVDPLNRDSAGLPEMLDHQPSTHFAELPASPTEDPEWILVEEGFTLAREHELESLFAIGNGYAGSRASLTEGSPLSAPATFVAGVFDSKPGSVPELAPMTDWTRLSAIIEGQPLRLDRGHNLEHRRILDMRQGIFWREWRHQDEAGRITRLQVLRLASLADRHLLVQCVTITPENYSGRMSVDATLTGPVVQVTGNGTTVAMAVSHRVMNRVERRTPSAEQVEGRQSFELKLGETYRFDRMVALHTSRDTVEPRETARRHVERAIEDVTGVIGEHRDAWLARWEASDLRIEGDPAAQRALRFAIYHLLSAANPQDDRVSIGARGLSGTTYKGHVFWDTDIFMLPFFILTYPEAAHALVIAPSNEVVRILTGEQEQHIGADVAFGVWNYWQATGDDRFLIEAGAEILFETARFWASRAEREEDGRYHIRRVIGPDEYHETVDDNAYTNGMAQWNLEVAREIADLIVERWPEQWQALSRRLGIEPEEPRRWQNVARDFYTGFDEQTGLSSSFAAISAWRKSTLPRSCREPHPWTYCLVASAFSGPRSSSGLMW